MESQEREDSDIDPQMNSSSNDKNELMKVSTFLEVNAPINKDTIRNFQAYATCITKKQYFNKKDREWLDDLVINMPAMIARMQEDIKDNNSGDKFFPVEDNNANKEKQEPNYGRRRLTPTPPMTESFTVPKAEFNLQTQDKLSKSVEVPKIKLNELVQRPEIFNGNKPPARRWLDDYERAAEANGWCENIKVRYFATFLEKSAHNWHITVARRKLGLNPDWIDLKAAFIRHYLGDCDRRTLRKQLETCKQGESERAINFIPRILRLIQLVDPHMPEEEIVEVIRDKLRQEFKDKMTLSCIYTIEILNDNCLRIEAELPNKINPTTSSVERHQNVNNKQTGTKTTSTRGNTLSRTNNSHKDQNLKLTPTSPTENVRRCYRCDRKYHIAAECYATSKEDGSPCNPAPSGIRSGTKRIQTIHTANDEINAEEYENEEEASTAGLNYVTNLMIGGGTLIELPISINKTNIKAIVDTGAFCSVINADLVRKNGWGISREVPNLFHAAGGKLNCVGTLKAKISANLGSKVVHAITEIVVVDKLCATFIMGIELIRKLQLTISPSEMNPITLSKRGKRKGAWIPKDTILNPRSITFITAEVQAKAEECMIFPFGIDNRIQVANAISKVDDQTIQVAIVNLDKKPILVEANKQIASIVTLPNVKNEPAQTINNIVQIGHTNEEVLIGDTLTQQEVKSLNQLLAEHVQAFLLRIRDSGKVLILCFNHL